MINDMFRCFFLFHFYCLMCLFLMTFFFFIHLFLVVFFIFMLCLFRFIFLFFHFFCFFHWSLFFWNFSSTFSVVSFEFEDIWLLPSIFYPCNFSITSLLERLFSFAYS